MFFHKITDLVQSLANQLDEINNSLQQVTSTVKGVTALGLTLQDEVEMLQSHEEFMKEKMMILENNKKHQQ